MQTVDVSLDQKIEELFSYRRFSELYDIAAVSSALRVEFHQKLKNLQTAIYHLDAHLEENWVLDEAILNDRWEKIYQSLSAFGIDEHQAESYCGHIKRYEKHEKQLRKGIMPQKYSMEYFYFYKSCDVKLMRRLIFESFPSLKKLFSLSEWRWFDLITEVNDDVTDVFEDLAFINGNSFLISLAKSNKAKTHRTFSDFIDYIETKNNLVDRSRSEWSQTIFEMTKQNISLTKVLLNENLNTFTNEDLKKSALFIQFNNSQ